MHAYHSFPFFEPFPFYPLVPDDATKHKLCYRGVSLPPPPTFYPLNFLPVPGGGRHVVLTPHSLNDLSHGVTDAHR